MEESRKELEKARERYTKMVLDYPDSVNMGTINYVYALEKTLAEYEHTLRAFNKLPPETELKPVRAATEVTLAEIQNAKNEVKKWFEDCGECGSCGYHGALYEYHLDAIDYAEGVIDGEMYFPCLSDDYLGHRGARIKLRPHPGREKLLVKVANGLDEVAPTTVNQDTILVAENLTEPLRAATPLRVHVDVQPEPFLDASTVEGGKKFGGTNVEKSGSGHKHDSNINGFTFEYLRKTLSEIALEHDHQIVHGYDDANYDSVESKVMQAVRDIRLSTLYDYLHSVMQTLEGKK